MAQALITEKDYAVFGKTEKNLCFPGKNSGKHLFIFIHTCTIVLTKLQNSYFYLLALPLQLSYRLDSL